MHLLEVGLGHCPPFQKERVRPDVQDRQSVGSFMHAAHSIRPHARTDQIESSKTKIMGVNW
jgi:hypothetical protein